MSEDFMQVKSAARAMQVVDVLARDPEGLPFADLQERTGWPRSSIFNLLRTLVETGHIDFDPRSRCYSVGLRIWEAGQAYSRASNLRRVAQPLIEAAAETLQETVQLAILDGLDNIYIGKADTSHHLRLVSSIGSRLPAHATGLGKVLLAHEPESDLRARLQGVELETFTEYTIATVDGLFEELERIREHGYATDHGEYTTGVFCIAVPVRDRSGVVVAAISSSVPEPRINDGLKATMHEVLDDTADRLSDALGYIG